MKMENTKKKNTSSNINRFKKKYNKLFFFNDIIIKYKIYITIICKIYFKNIYLITASQWYTWILPDKSTLDYLCSYLIWDISDDTIHMLLTRPSRLTWVVNQWSLMKPRRLSLSWCVCVFSGIYFDVMEITPPAAGVHRFNAEGQRVSHWVGVL